MHVKHLLASLAILLACALSAPAAQAVGRRPNVLVILVDDLGYGDISLHGCKDIATPRIDALAREGVRCTSGYVSGPYCSPTRAGLLTGRYQQRFGHEFNPRYLFQGGAGQGLSPREVTLASRLKDAGYATGLVGKWHLGEEDPFHPLNRGFQEFFGFLHGSHSYLQPLDPSGQNPLLRGRDKIELDGYLTDVLAREAAAFIDRHQKEPFFLYLPFNAVHTPMHATDARLQRFSSIQDKTRRLYAAMTLALDEAVGVVVDKLRTTGLEEDTLVFFLSDNGGPIGKFAQNGSTNGPLRGSKGDTWEGGIRVPFFVRWKGKLPTDTVYANPVIQLDIHATALAVAGVAGKADWKLDGVDLLPYLQGKDKTVPHPALYWRFGEQMAIRQGNWKLVKPDLATDAPFGNIAKQPMLYNLADDLGERTDLAAQQPKRVKQMWETWQQWNAELAPASWPHHTLQPAKKK